MTITGAEKETSKVNVGGALNVKTGVVTIDKHVELKSSATGQDDKSLLVMARIHLSLIRLYLRLVRTPY